MPFIAILFLVFALFLTARVPRGPRALWLVMVLATFGCCILGLIGLITRFGNYRLSGLVILPLDRPAWVGNLLGNLSLSWFMRYRLWSLMGFVASVLGFSLSYSTERLTRATWLTVASFALPASLLLRYYDPSHLFSVYQAGAALLDNPPARAAWVSHLRFCDVLVLGFVLLTLLYANGRLFRLWARSGIPQKSAQALCVSIGHSLLTTFFIILFCLGPARVLNAGTMASTLLPVADYPVFDITLLLVVPFAGLAAMGAVLLSIWRFGFLGTWHVGTPDLDRQIKVANQAVRLALHSFKNRFLAVQMAMEMAGRQLDGISEARAEAARTQIKEGWAICGEALAQLDALHVQARRLQVSPGTWSCRELWDEAARRWSDRADRIAIKVIANDPAFSIWGDREHLVAVLENLLQNAMDALAERAPDGDQALIRVEIGREYEWGYVRISDNGPGIPRANRRKVFRPFFTTKSSKSNWGMGLAYCHRVLKAHGGFINLRSRPGEGTTVEVVLRCRENLDARAGSLPS